MSGSALVLVVILLQSALFAAGWALLARLRIEREATLRWSTATLVLAGALALIVARGRVPDWVGYACAPWLVGLALALMQHGVQRLAPAREPPFEHTAVLGLYLLALWWAMQASSRTALVVGSSAVYAWQLWRMAGLIHVRLGAELGRARASACAAPFGLVGTLFAARALVAGLQPSSVGDGVQTDTLANHVTVVGFLVGSLLVSLGLLALVLSRLVQRLRHLSERDALTGLLNRGAIEALVVQEHARLTRYGQAYSALSLDIDHFKLVNDRHGHPAGDAVLRELGRTLTLAGRFVDRCGRAGGEEFWLLLPGTGQDGATQVAERLLQEVRALRLAPPLQEVRLTVSIGVVHAQRRDEPVEAVLRRLDAALYRAKESGRDRVVVAPSA